MSINWIRRRIKLLVGSGDSDQLSNTSAGAYGACNSCQIHDGRERDACVIRVFGWGVGGVPARFPHHSLTPGRQDHQCAVVVPRSGYPSCCSIDHSEYDCVGGRRWWAAAAAALSAELWFWRTMALRRTLHQVQLHGRKRRTFRQLSRSSRRDVPSCWRRFGKIKSFSLLTWFLFYSFWFATIHS